MRRLLVHPVDRRLLSPGPRLRGPRRRRAAPRRGHRRDRDRPLGAAGPQSVPIVHAGPITCGETVQGHLGRYDCAADQFFFDVYTFSGEAGQFVNAQLHSDDFDPFLSLVAADGTVVASDTNSGPGLDAQVVTTLDATSDQWALLPSSETAGATGDYTLTLGCSQMPQIPEGYFTDADYPDFAFEVKITPAGEAELAGTPMTGDCPAETVCVSGQLPDRAEMFIRILGPRLNGYLWPTLVRFTPSQVDVSILQLSTRRVQLYRLDAVPPDTQDLSGLQDRTGFLP